MSDALEALLAEEKLETVINFIKNGLTTLDAVIASGQMTPSEIEKIKAALEQN